MAESTRSEPAAEVVAQAIDWWIRAGDDAGDATQAACRAWRGAHPDHEIAWQRLAGATGHARETMAPVGARAGVDTLRVMADRPRQRRRILALALGGGVAAVTGYGATPAGWRADYRTDAGEQQGWTLAGGTRLQLNSGTAVDVRDRAGELAIVLQGQGGEVFVASGPGGGSYVVETPLGSIRPLGTRFLVRDLPSAGDVPHRVRVGLLEGRLALSLRADVPPLILHAGEQVEMRADGFGVPGPLPPTADAWTRGMLAVDDMPLADFLAELGRHRPGVLRCAPAVAGLRVSGAFPIRDTDQVLAFLASYLPIRIRTVTRYWVSIDAA